MHDCFCLFLFTFANVISIVLSNAWKLTGTAVPLPEGVVMRCLAYQLLCQTKCRPDVRILSRQCQCYGKGQGQRQGYSYGQGQDLGVTIASETNCTDNQPNTFALRSQKAIHLLPGEHGEILGRLEVGQVNWGGGKGKLESWQMKELKMKFNEQ